METTQLEDKRQMVKDALLSGPVVAELTTGRMAMIFESLDDWVVVDGGEHYGYDQIVSLATPSGAHGH
jgi:hypothetical protein